jgi:hypothetical protein
LCAVFFFVETWSGTTRHAVSSASSSASKCVIANTPSPPTLTAAARGDER